jgi:hypothetical protein
MRGSTTGEGAASAWVRACKWGSVIMVRWQYNKDTVAVAAPLKRQSNYSHGRVRHFPSLVPTFLDGHLRVGVFVGFRTILLFGSLEIEGVCVCVCVPSQARQSTDTERKANLRSTGCGFGCMLAGAVSPLPHKRNDTAVTAMTG